MTDKLFGLEDSWKMENDYEVICMSDVNMFRDGVVRIPDQLIDFFGADCREKRVMFLFEGREYPSYLESESMDGNFKLTWSKALSSKFIGLFPDYENFFADFDESKKEEQPYFVIEKLEETEFAIKVILPMDSALTVKQSLFDFLGPGKSLMSFHNSYELVFFKNYLQQVDNRWKSDVFMVSAGVQKYYKARVQAGKEQDRNAEKIIENVGTAGLDEVLDFLMDGPYPVFSEPGFISMENIDDHFYFTMDNTLIDELSTDDRQLIIELLDEKINYYFDRLDGPGLQENLTQMIDQYADFFTKDFRYSFKDVITDSIPGSIEGLSIMTGNRYKTVGFAGEEEWAEIPWIEIMDKQLSRFPNTSVAVKYLLNKDAKKLYLALTVGFKTIETKIIKNGGPDTEKARGVMVAEELRKIVAKIRSTVNPGTFSYDDDGIDLNDERFASGIAFYREYVGVVPGDNLLETDLAEMLEIYDAYYHRCVLKELPEGLETEENEGSIPGDAADSEPEHEETDELQGELETDGQTDETMPEAEDHLESEQEKDEHVSDMPEPETQETEIPEEVLTDVGEVQSRVDSLDQERADNTERKESNVALSVRPAAPKAQPAVPSVQVVSAGLTKKDIIALQKAMIEAQTEAQKQMIPEKEIRDRSNLYVEEKLEDQPKDIAGALRQITAYLTANGYSCDVNAVTNYYLCLKASPMVLVTGVAGIGKSTFVRLFAEALGANAQNGRFKSIPVRPSWHNAEGLLGHCDPSGHFIPGAMLDFVASAVENPDKPYFLCLDEMTLQKVEIYFSEILSVMGGRRSKGQKIITDPILGAEAFGMDEESRVYYGDLTIPENLFMIGTISSEAVEEEISAKLLDQSSVIELGQPDLKLMPAPNATPKVMAWGSEFLKRDIFHLSTVTNHRKMIVEVITLLDAMNGILSKADAQIGFRVRDEICYYLYYNAEYGLMTQEAALDYAITQKLLPRISGNSSETENVLIDLFKICAGTQADTAIKTYSGEGGLFPHCANKLSQMDHAFNQTGKVSYWKNK